MNYLFKIPKEDFNALNFHQPNIVKNSNIAVKKVFLINCIMIFLFKISIFEDEINALEGKCKKEEGKSMNSSGQRRGEGGL